MGRIKARGLPGQKEIDMRRSAGRCREAHPAWSRVLAFRPVLGCVFVLASVLVAALQGAPARGASTAIPTVGVVDFYAIPSISPFLITPERFTADDLSGMLTRAGTERITVVPRPEVLQAERAIGWRNDDVLHFARMGELAQRLHADRLVVGWIRDLRVDGDGFHVFFPFPNGDLISGYAVLQVQVFDTSQGRLVMSRQFTGDSDGFVPTWVAQEALHRALIPAVAPALEVLTGGQP